MATTDIRLQRVNDEYQSVRRAQDGVLDKVDGFEASVLGLNEGVAENRKLIMENREMIMENRELIAENSRKLDALLKHLEVPYKPPTGFIKE